MKRLWIILTLILLATVLKTIAEPSPQSANLNALYRWIGTWKSHINVKPAAWSLQPQKLSGTSKSVPILGGHFQQTYSRTSKHETREIHRHDAKSNQYHKWIFNSNGDTSFWTGTWDKKSSTMTWKYVDFGGGIKGSIVDRFINDGNYQSTLFLKDRTGNVLLDVETEHVRNKSQTE